MAIERTDPPVAADELTTLRGFLDHFRATLRRQAEGLDAEQLTRTVGRSDLALGGMLKHLTFVEHWWFEVMLHGREPSGIWADVDWDADEDWDWHSAVHDSPAELDAMLVEQVAASDAALEEALADGGLDRLAVRSRRGEQCSLRWILVHMVEEYARHCGHADLVRESIDGGEGPVRIRPATGADWPAIWPFWREIVEAGETYAYPLGATSEQARGWWFDGSHVVVLVGDEDGRILGTAKMGPNRPGRGSHVGTASFMVDPSARGRGVGRTLGAHAVEWHREQGFAGIQFNAVVETNTAAVRLWQDLGFVVVGTVPGAFDSASHGRVGLHVMYLDLS